MTTTAPVTADELYQRQYRDKQVELLRGQVVVREPPGTWHGKLSGDLTGILHAYVRKHRLGVILGQDTGFKLLCNPDTVRAPDVAFVSSDRVKDIPRRGYASLAPDLVVEIVSARDTEEAVLAKAADWLRAGTRLVWVIDPEQLEARAYRPDASVTRVGILTCWTGKMSFRDSWCPWRTCWTDERPMDDGPREPRERLRRSEAWVPGNSRRPRTRRHLE